MSERPWMPMYWGDYLADTLDLGPDEHGAYLLMIGIAWRRPDCALPNDMKLLKRMLGGCCSGMHGNRFNRIVPPILERFWTLESDGKWHQKRLGKEQENARKRSRNAQESARKRWGEPKDDNDLEDATAMHARASTITTTKKTQSPSTQTESLSPASKPPSAAPNGAGHSDRHTYQFDDWWACWDIPGTKKDRAAAERKYRAAIKADAATHDVLCDGVRRYMAWCRKERREVRYIKAPDVWLNKGCWADELGATGPPTTQRRPFEDLSDYTAENYPPQPPGGRHD